LRQYPGLRFRHSFDTLAILRAIEVVLVLRFLHPTALTFRFALSATSRFCAIAQMVFRDALFGFRKLVDFSCNS
jgi:hypothetical protein